MTQAIEHRYKVHFSSSFRYALSRHFTVYVLLGETLPSCGHFSLGQPYQAVVFKDIN